MRRIIAFILSGGVFLALKGFFSGGGNYPVYPSDSSYATSVYGVVLKSLDGGDTIDLSAFKGKKILFVNTASECGYTPQYEGLQRLQDSYSQKLVIIGSPCNQFGFQEPGDSAAIRQFCTNNYQIRFLLSEKLDVKGEKQHPLYAWLTQKKLNGVLDTQVRWNFNKFLVDENGRLIAYFPSKIGPDNPELLKWIKE